MKELILAIVFFCFILYITTGAALLVTFYGWSKWTMTLPLLILLNLKVGIKSDDKEKKCK